MAEKYIAKIVPLNADKIGTSAHGEATFEIVNDKLRVVLVDFEPGIDKKTLF